MTDLLESLNPVQRQAVQHTEGPLLILSGAGSGKTRVITHRIAYLIREHGVSPFNILAVTFTNKAAGEMKTRLENLISAAIKPLWVATFHSTCARILRRDIEHLGYDRSFTIYDTSDQQTLIKELIKTLQLRLNNPSAVLGEISRAKNDFETPEQYAKRADGFFQRSVAEVYPAYQDFLKANNAVDFDDLIRLTVELFEGYPRALEFYQEKFRYILVDEYQDTNRGQYLLIHHLAAKHHNVCVVGDDDQSIYSWRGADIHNILDFERDYPETTVLRLEQNYRSTQNILEAAYQVVRNNRMRKEKRLWTENAVGSPITCHQAYNDSEEAAYVVEQIRGWRKQGMKYGDCVIFYRINAQSRSFEEALRATNIPYQIVGSIRFYERMEIKDMMAYMRVIVNPADTISLKRIINVPRRGIGDATVERIAQFAQELGISLFEGLRRVDEVPSLRAATKMRIQEFVALVTSFYPTDPPARVADDLLNRSGYLEALRREGTIESQSREENLREFIAAVAEYEDSDPAPTLTGFLEMITLVSDIDTMEDKSDVVTMMTLHSAKGLEFPVVFIAGVEEGLLPHQRSFNTEAELEEERRLCYVGITRAKEHAYITHTRQRRLYRDVDYRLPSRFIGEIPKDLLNEANPLAETRRPVVSSYDPDEEFSFNYHTGDIVYHATFGRGKVVQIDGSRITVRFERGVEKTLVAEYAKLQKMG